MCASDSGMKDNKLVHEQWYIFYFSCNRAFPDLFFDRNWGHLFLQLFTELLHFFYLSIIRNIFK